MRRFGLAVLSVTVLLSLGRVSEVAGALPHEKWRGVATFPDGTTIIRWRVFTYVAGIPGPLMAGLSGRYRCQRETTRCLKRKGHIVGRMTAAEEGGPLTFDATVEFRDDNQCVLHATTVADFPRLGARLDGEMVCTFTAPATFTVERIK